MPINERVVRNAEPNGNLKKRKLCIWKNNAIGTKHPIAPPGHSMLST